MRRIAGEKLSCVFSYREIVTGYWKEMLSGKRGFTGKGDADMSERAEIVFIQTRLLCPASEEWHMPIQKASDLFYRHGILKFIEDCYGVFHMEGDHAVFEEVKAVLKNKGVDLDAGII